MRCLVQPEDDLLGNPTSHQDVQVSKDLQQPRKRAWQESAKMKLWRSARTIQGY